MRCIECLFRLRRSVDLPLPLPPGQQGLFLCQICSGKSTDHNNLNRICLLDLQAMHFSFQRPTLLRWTMYSTDWGWAGKRPMQSCYIPSPWAWGSGGPDNHSSFGMGKFLELFPHSPPLHFAFATISWTENICLNSHFDEIWTGFSYILNVFVDTAFSLFYVLSYRGFKPEVLSLLSCEATHFHRSPR